MAVRSVTDDKATVYSQHSRSLLVFLIARYMEPIKYAVSSLVMTRSNRKRDVVLALLAVVAVSTASVLGQIATFPNLSPWFADLIKPSFSPPNWVFGPVWTALYALMAFALWRILRRPSSSPGYRLAVALFFLQLAFNAAWSWLFFWAHSPLLGLLNIVPQLLLILATIAAFARLDRWAAWCLVPLAAWVAYASVLNFALWRLNG